MQTLSMRKIWAAGALALAAATPALAQPAYGGPPPPGAYQRQCANIRMEGQFLHATCRGAHGGGESSINVASCSTGIFVDDGGALACIGPGGGAPPTVRDAPPGYNTGQGQAQGRGYERGAPAYGNRGAPGYGDRGYRGRDGGQQMTASLFRQHSWRGMPVQVWGPTPNLAATGMNDRVRSIQIDRRAGPWQVCSDAGYRGRCVTIRDSVPDVRALGIDGVSSLRPVG